MRVGPTLSCGLMDHHVMRIMSCWRCASHFIEAVAQVGTSFDGRQQLLKHMEPSQPLLLVREPENPFDANAVAVRACFSDRFFPMILSHVW